MTIVRVKVQVPADGPPVAATGSLRWSPTARRIIPSVGAEPATILLPNEFRVTLAGGAEDIDVEPSGIGWVWAVMEQFDGQPSRRRFLAVPDQESIDYTDLVEIDPATLAPIPAQMRPAWIAALEALAASTITPDPDDPGFFLIGAS